MENKLIKELFFVLNDEPRLGMAICDCTMGNNMNLNTNKDVFNERGEL